MARHDPANFVMSDPVTPCPRSSEEKPSTALSTLTDFSSAADWGERLFKGPQGVYLVWRILVYLGTGGVVVYVLLWFGKSFFPEPVYGAAALWQDLYGEAALMLGAFLPAILMGRIEGRPVDDYGLPRRQAFGKLFWVGAAWGLAAITLLLMMMYAVHVLFLGPIALHGMRILKFAAFWAAFFVLVGLFEEFLLRGYLLFTIAQTTGFWPAAALFSCLFGAIHLRNAGEGPVGVLGAAAIGFFFCLTLRRTGNLWFAVGFHLSWDWGETYLYAVPNSGTTQPGHLLSSWVSGKVWLTGGTVGPEGSVLCFVLLVVLWVVFDRMYPTATFRMGLPGPHTANESLSLRITSNASEKSLE
jgi:membrane protease YdiL (CAAX protease family)